MNPATNLRSQTVLQQMLEEINFQRTKEMRQHLKDDSGFVVLQGTTYWTDLFVRHFLFETEADANDTEADDILFFVRKKHVKGTSRNLPKYDTEVDVYRKDSRKLPIGDPDVDWEETVYLNLIIHQFNYTLTLAICTRTSPKELQVLRRHSQRVYASPSRRKMDTKGEGEEMTFPHICFMVDNFDEVFSDIMVRDGEMVCVELVASDRDGTVQGVIFLGSIRYDALKKVYDSRQSSLSSKVAQRMTFGLFSAAGPQTRCEFVRMKGPQGKGHAEMAVTKPKGSGVETPTSEPGFCATDMWDEWEEDSENYYTNRHQRRLSDPSANLNNFSRHGWKAKGVAGGNQPPNDDGETVGSSASNRFSGKARSQNEGLDSIANELSEVEAGDLKDDRPASSVHTQPPTTTTTTTTSTGAKASRSRSCCPGCFGKRGSQRNRWSDAGSSYGCQMSEVYCRDCEPTATVSEAAVANSPACLATVSTGAQRAKAANTTLLNVRSELEMLGGSQGKNVLINSNQTSPTNPTTGSTIAAAKTDRDNNMSAGGAAARLDDQDLEFGDDVSAGMGGDDDNGDPNEAAGYAGRVTQPKASACGLIRVHGAVELPTTEANAEATLVLAEKTPPPTVDLPEESFCVLRQRRTGRANDSTNGNGNDAGQAKQSDGFATLPKFKRANSVATSNPVNNGAGYRRKVPMRTTPDGTNIYYWCELSKRAQKELDDGAYNPLWTSRGFTQTFHFWKEHRRQQSTPLSAFLTYVTLPWWSIAKDLLDHRETPILTF